MFLANDFNVPMALVDFIPCILFAISAVILQRNLYDKMSKGAFSLFSAGTFNIFCAGTLKALYKLLYALGVCDFQPLSQMFFPVQSIGFLLAGLGLVAMLTYDQKVKKLSAVVPPLFTGTFIFVGLMVTGLGMICACLSVLACKLHKKRYIALFVVAFVCSMCMGYLSSQDFEKASMNWIAEGVNTIGQSALLIGAYYLKKSGLKDLDL